MLTTIMWNNTAVHCDNDCECLTECVTTKIQIVNTVRKNKKLYSNLTAMFCKLTYWELTMIAIIAYNLQA